MALPVLLGIPVLISAIGSFFAGLFAFFVSIVTRQVALKLLVIAGMASLTTAFLSAMAAFSNAISAVSPPFLSMALSWAIPPNFSLCVSTICSVYVTRWVYDWSIAKMATRF